MYTSITPAMTGGPFPVNVGVIHQDLQLWVQGSGVIGFWTIFMKEE